MKKHLNVIGITLMLLAVGLSGCTETDDTAKFVGIWERIETNGDIASFTFFSNGTYNLNDEISGKYEIIDGKLITYVSEIPYENEYYFSDNDTKLHLTYPGIEHTVVYTKTGNYE